MTAIALTIVWYVLASSNELKNSNKPVQQLGYGIASLALTLIFMLAIKEVFK